jgi:hypothetical protein
MLDNTLYSNASGGWLLATCLKVQVKCFLDQKESFHLTITRSFIRYKERFSFPLSSTLHSFIPSFFHSPFSALPSPLSVLRSPFSALHAPCPKLLAPCPKLLAPCPSPHAVTLRSKHQSAYRYQKLQQQQQGQTIPA